MKNQYKILKKVGYDVDFEDQNGIPVLVPIADGGATTIGIDEEFSSIVGWDGIPTDDEAEPMKFVGARLLERKITIFVCGNANLAAGKDYLALYSEEGISEEIFSQLVKWVEKKTIREINSLIDEETRREREKIMKGLSEKIIRAIE